MNDETMLPLPLWAVLLIFVFCWPSIVFAEAKFAVQDKDVTITFYDEPCTLTDQVANLPYRATWVEGGKTFEGCAAPRPDHQLVVAYFSDHSIALIPFSVIKKLDNT